MIWQDVVLGVANWVLVAAPLPTVFSRGSKPALLTCLITTTTLAAMAYALFTLRLYQGSLGMAAASVVWLILLVQVVSPRNMSMGTVLRRTARGTRDHPGTVILLCITFLGAVAGAIRGSGSGTGDGWGVLAGAGIMLAVFGPFYLYGAYEGGRLEEEADHWNNQGSRYE